MIYCATIPPGFGEKVWQHYPMLMRRARKLSPDSAEDLVSETMLRALTGKHDGTPDLRPWLFTILKNRFINLVRSPWAVRRDWDDDFSDIADLPTEADNALLGQVLKFSAVMKPEDAEVLTLAALGNTCAEIGKRLAISSAAAQSRWFRAVRRLRVLVGADEIRRSEKLSRYRGVTPHQGGYRVRLRLSDKEIVGRSGFKTEIEAARHYNEIALMHLGDRAILNELPEVAP